MELVLKWFLQTTIISILTQKTRIRKISKWNSQIKISLEIYRVNTSIPYSVKLQSTMSLMDKLVRLKNYKTKIYENNAIVFQSFLFMII